MTHKQSGIDYSELKINVYHETTHVHTSRCVIDAFADGKQKKQVI